MSSYFYQYIEPREDNTSSTCRETNVAYAVELLVDRNRCIAKGNWKMSPKLILLYTKIQYFESHAYLKNKAQGELVKKAHHL